jgi:predicted acyl esterase
MVNIRSEKDGVGESFRLLWITALLTLLTIVTSLSGFAAVPPSSPAYGVRMEDTWIPMKDGVRLAVKLYMADGAKAGDKFPAVLEYHPYRKDDGTAARDYPLYAYFARRG